MLQLGMGSPQIVRREVRLPDGLAVFLHEIEYALSRHLPLDRLLGPLEGRITGTPDVESALTPPIDSLERTRHPLTRWLLLPTY